MCCWSKWVLVTTHIHITLYVYMLFKHWYLTKWCCINRQFRRIDFIINYYDVYPVDKELSIFNRHKYNTLQFLET